MIDVGKVIRLDKNTSRVFLPNLFLKDRSLNKKYGKIPHYTNFHMSIVGATVSEISFDVHKYVDGIKCPVWDKLKDLSIVSIDDKYNFEAQVTYTDNTETIKSVNCTSLECELGQVMLNNFHVNDDDAMTYVSPTYDNDGNLIIYNNDSVNFDSNGNFIPTVFYDANDEDHSLLHRVLKDKAPHWSIGHVPTYVAIDEDTNAELANEFQRTYTVDGTSIYDFLTEDVAKETNVVFLFDTENRVVDCYSLINCYSIVGNEKILLESEIGSDTSIVVSKDNLADEIVLNSNKDSLKNCFNISGGDDIINAYVAAVNLTGTNYIYQFSNIQTSDMSSELVSAIEDYQELIDSSRDDYIGTTAFDSFKKGEYCIYITSENEAISVLSICSSLNISTLGVDKSDYSSKPYWFVVCVVDQQTNERSWNLSTSATAGGLTSHALSWVEENVGIFTLLSEKYGEKSYIESSMMPYVTIADTDAEEVYNSIREKLSGNESEGVGVYALSIYDSSYYIGVTNNIKAMADVYCDPRYSVEIKGSNSYDNVNHIWTGNILVKKIGDESDFYPKTPEQIADTFDVEIHNDADDYLFTKQKIEKSLAKLEISDIDFDIVNKTEIQIEEDKEAVREYLDLFCLNMLKTYSDAYEECIGILDNIGESSLSDITDRQTINALLDVKDKIRESYYIKYDIINNSNDGLLKKRQEQFDYVCSDIEEFEKEKSDFQSNLNLKENLGTTLYKEFCSYIREDSYQNQNYISDGLSVTECIAKAKELVEVATKEIKKACKLQYTLSANMHNLLILPEFSSLYDDFSMFNYIRLRTDDGLYKLKLLGVECNGDSMESINVTFADEIESLDGDIEDVQSILAQASSMATSYTSTVLQAKHGNEAQNAILDNSKYGLNVAKTSILNNYSEVSIDERGISCKRMDDEGMYGEKQLRITGNMIAMTDDNWESLKLAIGETVFLNPDTNTYVNSYGIIAPNIVGDMIVGQNLRIRNGTNGNESVDITSSGIKITNGTIYLEDKRTSGNTGISVEINPNGTNFTGHDSNYVFSIQKGNGASRNLIMGVDTFGNGYFKGDIAADSLIVNDSIGEAGKFRTGIYSVNSLSGRGVFIQPTRRSVGEHSAVGFGYRTTSGQYISYLMDIEYTSSGADINHYYGGDSILPIYDDEMSLGTSNNRFTNVYATSGVVSTSDANEKEVIGNVTSNYENAFMELEPILYKYKNFDDKAHQHDRIHCGLSAQSTEIIFDKHGIKTDDFALVCKDVSEDKFANGTNERYGLKYQELHGLEIHMIQKLYNEVNDLKEEIKRLKGENG